jgi:polyhydroxyalkanoate depolymerase
MPSSFMTLFPHVLNGLEAMKVPMQTSVDLTETAIRCQSLSFDLMRNTQDFGCRLMKALLPATVNAKPDVSSRLSEICREGTANLLSLTEKNVGNCLARFQRERKGELEFVNFFTEELPDQDWTVAYDDSEVILDLPGLRLIDISADVKKHEIQNYGVVFAPRAGHHSNIAERVALFMRDQGLTRMAIVEQKCAEDIPLYINGKRHYENFDGQVEQYKKVLETLKERTGYPPHLIAICQPGPLLMSTLILYPHLGKTFGSAGAPMNTDGERGYLTDFARMAGEGYIEKLVSVSGHTVSDKHEGAGRESYDGRVHVFGFYFLGMDQHFKNLRRLLTDLKQGNKEDAQRQKAFYRWYNYVNHAPIGFIRDTYQKIFVKNELISGKLAIHGKVIGVKDYPDSVPIWALGGSKDAIAPPLQATGHMDMIDSIPQGNKLTLICNGGHMGLFRSSKILKEYYTKITKFILIHSDKAAT